MAEIDLGDGWVTIVDDEDYQRLIRYRWRAYTTPSGTYVQGSKWKSMHRMLMDAKRGEEVDHINRNPLDNRKANLRIATRQQNCVNAKVPRTNTSGYKGVTWNAARRMWRADISVRGQRYHLGSFARAEDAARAYNAAATQGNGEFARPNVISPASLAGWVLDNLELSEEERTAAELVMQGLTFNEVGARLGLSLSEAKRVIGSVQERVAQYQADVANSDERVPDWGASVLRKG